MPLYAIVDGRRRAVVPDGPRRASCADCGAEMLARTGTVKVWHWAHRTRNPGCPAAAETEWHLAWKALGLDGTQEIAVGRRRADVLAPGGFAVEFQASPLTEAEVRAREDDWAGQGSIAWVFKADAEYAAGRITLTPSLREWTEQGLVKPENQATLTIAWSHAPERVRAARAPSFLDIGDGLLFVGAWRPKSSPLTGYGWRVTKDSVVRSLLHGDTIPGQLAGDPAEVERRIRAWQERERARQNRERLTAIRALHPARAARPALAARLRAWWQQAGKPPPPPGSFERWAQQLAAGTAPAQVHRQMKAALGDGGDPQAGNDT